MTELEDYFQFNKMITTLIIRWLYGFGILAIISTGFFLIVKGVGYRGDENFIYGGIAIIIFGNLFWRLLCEGWIIFFKIHESLVYIEYNE